MEDENFDKLPTEERCGHKSWKARVSGYTSLATTFNGLDEGDVDAWNKYGKLVERILTDNNDPALEKGLETVLLFVDKSPTAGKFACQIVAGLVKRCLASSRPRSRELALLISLSYVEIEKHNVLLDELIKGAGLKNPKTATACLHVITEVVKNFGPASFDVNTLIKKAIDLSEEKDLNVRNGAKFLIVELYKWMGSSLRPHLDRLKSTKLSEIEVEMSKTGNLKPAPMRYFRSRQNHRLCGSRNSSPSISSTPDIDHSEQDQYGSTEAVDLLPQISAEFYTRIKSPKWTERKEALESLEKTMSSAERIQNGDFAELVTTLINLVSKDANVVVVSLAVKCLNYLASGLRDSFHPHNLSAFRAILDKMKEKKQIVVNSLREALNTLIKFMSIESVVLDLIDNLKNKNPSVRSETTRFLSICLTSKLRAGDLKNTKPLLVALAAALVDQDSNVRENSVKALGSAWAVYGERSMAQILSGVEEAKRVKIKKYAESLSRTCDAPKEEFKKRKSFTETREPKKLDSLAKSVKKKKIPSEQKAHGRKCENARQESNETDDILTNHIPYDVIKAVSSREWSERAQALLEIHNKVNSMKSISPKLGELPELLIPRIADNNPKIAASTISLVSALSQKIGPHFQDVKRFLPSLLKAVGDSKVQIREAAISCVSSIGKTSGYKEIFEEVFSDYLKSGSQSARVVLWRWLGEVLLEMSPNEIPKESLCQCLSALFASCQDRNVDVRNEASKAILGFIKHLGRAVVDSCEKFFGCKNNSVMRLIVEKYPEVQNPLSKRLLNPSKGSVNRKALRSDSNERTSSLLDVNNMKHQRVFDDKQATRDLTVPQTGFVHTLKTLMTSANFSSTLVLLMFDGDPQNQIKAMDLLGEEISQNSRGIICNLDLILRWITLRFFDTNPAVVKTSLDFALNALTVLKELNYCLLECEALAFVPYLIMKLSDSQENVQSRVKEVLLCLSALYPVGKLTKFIIDGIRTNNLPQKANCLDILSTFIETYGEPAYMKDMDSIGECLVKLMDDQDEVVKKRALAIGVSLFDREGEKIMGCLEKCTNDSVDEEQIRKYVRARQAVKIPPVLRGAQDVVYDKMPSALQSEQDRNDVAEQDWTGYRMDPALLEEVERISNAPIVQPNLTDVDVGFLYQDPPHTRPLSKCYQSMYSLNTSFKAALNGIASDDPDASVEAMRRIDAALNSDDKNGFLLEQVDTLLSQIVQKLRNLSAVPYQENELRCYGVVFTMLLTICRKKSFMEKVSLVHLYSLMEKLLSLISNNRFDEEGNESYRKAVNAVILNVLGNSNKTLLMCALLKMLGETRDSRQTVVSGKMHELCMKCLWKLNRMQSKWDDELDYVEVLGSIEMFLSAYPGKWWKSKEDSALRTVKTILRTMAKMRGRRVLDEFRDAMDSELFQYLGKLVKYFCDKSRGEVIDSYEDLTARIAKELSVIFNRFAQDPQDGTRLLDDFRRSHPGVNLHRILGQLSPAMLQYYESSLNTEEPLGDNADECEEDRTNRPMRYEDFSKEAQRLWDRLEALQGKIQVLNSHRELKLL